MKYVIRVEYQTGDSFGSEDTEAVLDYDWHDKEVVRRNLQRIKSQYDFYQKYAREYHGHFEAMKRDFGHEPWFVDITNDTRYARNMGLKEFCATHSVMLVKDDGTQFQHSCEWEGYFEYLYGASIEEVGDSEDSFTVERW